MSAPKDPAVTPEPEVREVPNEELLKAVHDLAEVAKDIKGDAEKRLEAARIMKEVEEQRKKNRVIATSPTSPPTVKTSLREVLAADEPANEFERDVRETWRDLRLVHELMAKAAAAGKIQYGGPQTLRLGKRFANLVQKADHWDTGTDTAGGGTVGSQDWVQVMYSSEPLDYFHLKPIIAANMVTVNVPDRTGSFRVPIATSESTVDVVAEQTAAVTTMMQASAGPNTDYLTLTPVKHRGGILMSAEFTEDSALDALGYARKVLLEDMALALDDAILNGQATTDDANHDGSNSSAPANGSYNGLRYFAHYSPGSNETSNSGAVFESQDVKSMRGSMGKFGVVPTDCRLIVSPAGYLSLVADDTNKSVLTVDKYGAAATIVTGELARVFGIPVLVSDRMPENMNNTGDLATTSTLTGAILFNRTRWILGMKRQVTLKLVEHAAADQYGLYAFMRSALAGETNDNNHTWYMYNILLA